MAFSDITLAVPYVAAIQNDENPDSVVSLGNGQSSIRFGQLKKLNSATTAYVVDDRVAYFAEGVKQIIAEGQQYDIIEESSILFKETIVAPE